MDFIKIKSNNLYLLRIRVKTNSKKQEILRCSKTDYNLTILLRSKPIQNKANRELLNLIKKKLKVSSDQVQIIAGLKKADKILQVSFSENIVESDIINRIFN
ncbi:hypothetical protein ES705_06664 [subsurface metagenome]|jgi:uncharacterized protein (TIGR00251 family)